MLELESVQVARQNCNAVEQRKRVSRTSEMQTRRISDKQLSKNKLYNARTLWRCHEFNDIKATKPTLTLHSSLSAQTQHTDYERARNKLRMY